MNLRKKLFDLSLESKGLYYRLPIIFALFFFVPLLGLLYFGLSYDFRGKKSDVPVFILVLPGLFPRRICHNAAGLRRHPQHLAWDIKSLAPESRRGASGKPPTNCGDRPVFSRPSKGASGTALPIWKSGHHNSPLQGCRILCYVTFNSDDLFAITMERAMEACQCRCRFRPDPGGPKRETFVVHATYGLGELVKKGGPDGLCDERRQICRNQQIPAPHRRHRTGQPLRSGEPLHYGTKSFLCMPPKGSMKSSGCSPPRARRWTSLHAGRCRRP